MATAAIPIQNASLPFLTPRLIEPKEQAKREREQLLKEEFTRLSEAIHRLIEPLILAKDEAELDQILQEELRPYTAWKTEFYALLLSPLSEKELKEFWEIYQRWNEEVREILDREAQQHLLEEDKERLLYAHTGLSLYSETLLRTLTEEGPQAVDLEAVRATLGTFLKAELLLFAVLLILDRKLLTDAPPEEIRRVLTLLVRKGETLVSHIEDMLIVRDPEVRRRLEQPVGKTLSLEECWKQLSS